MSIDLIVYFDEDGTAKEYNDTYDVIIHCESEKEHDELLNKLERFWQCDHVLEMIKTDLWMEGVNMTDEYQGVWVRYKDIERIIDKYKAESEV